MLIELKYVNLEYLYKTLGAVHENIIKILEMFVYQASENIENMKISFSNKDIARVIFIAHKSKNDFNILGISNLIEISKAIEMNYTFDNNLIINNLIDNYIEYTNRAIEEVKKIIEYHKK